MYSSLNMAHKKTCKQWEPWIRACLLDWLKDVTISEMRQDGEEKDRITDSLGITAPEDLWLKMRPDIMMVGLTTDDLNKIERRTLKKCKAVGPPSHAQGHDWPKKVTILKIGYIADTRYKVLKPRFCNIDLSARSLKRKGKR